MFDPHVFGVDTQRGRPGVISGADEVNATTGLPGSPRAYDVTCPGCGQFVACLPQKPTPRELPDGSLVDGPAWPFTGPRDRFTCLEPIEFGACCGWFGVLIGGLWVGR